MHFLRNVCLLVQAVPDFLEQLIMLKLASMAPSDDVWECLFVSKKWKYPYLVKSSYDKVYLIYFYFLSKMWLLFSINFSLTFITIIEIKFLLFIYSIILIYEIVIEITFLWPCFYPKSLCKDHIKTKWSTTMRYQFTPTVNKQIVVYPYNGIPFNNKSS